jgi:hypothetical protein
MARADDFAAVLVGRLASALNWEGRKIAVTGWWSQVADWRFCDGATSAEEDG